MARSGLRPDENLFVIAHAVAIEPTPVTSVLISWFLNEIPSGVLFIPGIRFRISASAVVAVTKRILRGMDFRM
jgi:hypothetical protein